MEKKLFIAWLYKYIVVSQIENNGGRTCYVGLKIHSKITKERKPEESALCACDCR